MESNKSMEATSVIDLSDKAQPITKPESESKTTASQQQEHTSEYAPYPKLDPADVKPPPLVDAAARDHQATAMPAESNPYVTSAPIGQSSSAKLKDVLGKWGKKMGEAAKKTEDLAGNVWQHLKTGPSVADAAMSRIAQGTKVLAEGGYEKIFKQTFETFPEEQLKKTYACYLSTSAGPVMGVLYLSSLKIAFCSDSPLSYKVEEKTEWSYYKVVIPLHQLRVVNPSTSQANPSEKYIQVASVDNHEFWFMGFVNYDSAVKSLQDAMHSAHDSQPS